MSISAGLLVAAIAAIRAVALNRLPKKMFLVLWGMVLFRLLVPIAIPVTLPVSTAVTEVMEMALPSAAVQPMREITALRLTAVEAPATAQQQTANVPWLTVVWLAGMLTAFVFFAVIYFRNYEQLRFATPASNHFLQSWLRDNRLTRPITILHSDRTKTPLAVGILRPKIILPKSMDMDSTQLLSYVLCHEYYHIARLDALWKMLFVFALCIHWFNPMMWVMFALVNRDLELTCDEMVLRRFGTETKTAYAYTLIGLAEQGRGLTALHSGFVKNSKNATEERIVSIMTTKRKSTLSVTVACMLVAVLVAGSFVVLAGNDEDSEPLLTQFKCYDNTVVYDQTPQFCDNINLLIEAETETAPALEMPNEPAFPPRIIYHYGMAIDFSHLRASLEPDGSGGFGRTLFIDDIPPLLYIFGSNGWVTTVCINSHLGQLMYDYFENQSRGTSQELADKLSYIIEMKRANWPPPEISIAYAVALVGALTQSDTKGVYFGVAIEPGDIREDNTYPIRIFTERQED